MPTAGEEGYEKLVICPYDKSHEIRQGRMQFHLDKCRKNHPGAKVECPFNSTHLIYKQEEAYHIEYECDSRRNWDIYTHEDIGGPQVTCPVKDLVSVNAGVLPDADENWDNYEAPGSVLNTIKTEAEGKKILRMLQCESKAKRKAFRRKEVLRHGSMDLQPSCSQERTPVVEVNSGPAARPRRGTTIPVERKQNPEEAKALLNKQFLGMNISGRGSPEMSRPESRSSDLLGTDHLFAPSSSSSTPLSFASALSRPHNDTSATSVTRSRPSTAMNIARSSKNVNNDQKPLEENFSDRVPKKPFEEGTFCQMPIPGSRGRGIRLSKNN